MKRRLTLIGFIGIFILLASTFVRGQQPVFRIGVMDSVNGPISNGARLAVQTINEVGGGVRGADGTFFQLQLIIQPIDNGGTLADAARNLSQASVIAVLGPESNETMLLQLPTLQTLNVPVLTAATGDTILASDNTGRIFRSRAAEVWRGRALASYLVNDLGASSITTVQLDQNIDTAAALIGFSTAASALGRAPQPALLLQNRADLPQLVNQVSLNNPQIVVTYGDATTATQIYVDLREIGWEGFFAYNEADNPLFRQNIPAEQLAGILSTTTWPFTADDAGSDLFRDVYIRNYGGIPGPVEAASYDAILLLAGAIGQPGELVNNLAQLDNVVGVQGLLRPSALSRGETSDNVAVVQLNEFGAPQVLVRFQGNERVSEDAPIGPIPTATPQGVVATITRAVQNVRSGPGTIYPTIGQLRQGEQARVIGANIDFSWLVIEFRGQQGWLSASILDVFGDLNSLPIVNPPPTPTVPPTPIPPPTSTASPQPDIVIDAASGAPSPFIRTQQFTVSVTVRNAGGSPAGQFAIAATFPPNNVYASAIIPGLAPGQSTIANLTGTLTNTGFYSVVMVADLNSEVLESNESNNLFNFSYAVNQPILRQSTQALNPGDTLDLEGNAVQGDVNWDGSALNAIFGAQIGVIPNITLSTVHWDILTATYINQTSIPNASLAPGTIVGIKTADGNRGAMRVDSLGGQLSLTFVVYSPQPA